MGLFSSKSKKHYLFTSESVGEGHPDKLCDQISDAVLDECLRLDSDAHVACETFATTDFVLVGGEVKFTKNAEENAKKLASEVESIARRVACDIGYTDEKFGLDGNKMEFMNRIHAQSSDIAQGVEGTGLEEFKGQQGAGDQGMMFGFACSETPELMPATLIYSHNILRRATELRKTRTIPWLRPDAKSQVTIEYEGFKPVRIDTVVVSHQHDPEISHEEIESTIIEKIIKPVLEPTGLLDSNTKFFINPTGSFVKGGPDGDAGLTGRKIIVDTYGGMGRHGGGAFSGKDPSKVDRSAAYMARYIAKNIVAQGLAERCEVQLSYAIGLANPMALRIDTFGTAKVRESQLHRAVARTVDTRPMAIIRKFGLTRPIFSKVSCYGHFGSNAADMPWEQTDLPPLL